MLLITEGFHVPVKPFNEVVGKAGAIEPSQKAAILLNFGLMTGLDKMIPVLRSVIHPLIANSKSE